jgi:hypothetical protein
MEQLLQRTADFLTLSTGIDGHALHKFQNEPIMRNSAYLINTLKATEEKSVYSFVVKSEA